jgi:hypothetical protein
VFSGYARLGIFDDDHGSTDPTTIARDVDGTLAVIDVYRDEFRCPPTPSKLSEAPNEAYRRVRNSDQASVDVDNVHTGAVKFISRNKRDVYKVKPSEYHQNQEKIIATYLQLQAERQA